MIFSTTDNLFLTTHTTHEHTTHRSARACAHNKTTCCIFRSVQLVIYVSFVFCACVCRRTRKIHTQTTVHIALSHVSDRCVFVGFMNWISIALSLAICFDSLSLNRTATHARPNPNTFPPQLTQLPHTQSYTHTAHTSDID